MTQTQHRPTTPLAPQTRTHAEMMTRCKELQDIVTAIHMHTVEADHALLRRAWTLAQHGKVLPNVPACFLGPTLMRLTHLREDDVTLAGFLVQGGEVRARSWTGMWAGEERAEQDADTLLQGAVEGGGPVTVVFCRLICTAMDPDLDGDHDWDLYEYGQAVDAFMAYRITDF